MRVDEMLDLEHADESSVVVHHAEPVQLVRADATFFARGIRFRRDRMRSGFIASRTDVFESR